MSFRPILIALVALIVIGGGVLLLSRGPGGGSSPGVPQGNLTGAAIGGPFTLVDQDGRTVTDRDFAGRWRLMYFGFTYCPDVCPLDMQKIAAGFSAFEKAQPARAEKVVPMFVTVDPARDTPKVVKEFVSAFHPRFVGLTGSEAQVEAAKTTFRIYAQKRPGGTPQDYLVDHSAMIYLMDPNGRPVEFIVGQQATPEAITAMLTKFVA